MLLPSDVLAVIVTVPAFFPVTKPVLLTVAIVASPELHVTPLLDALLGVTVADN